MDRGKADSDWLRPLEAQGASDGCIPAGTRVGDHYRVERVLGRGSMGVVYVATDTALQREVAIKVLAPHYAADQRVAARFRREAVTMANVRNENVVQIFAFGEYRSQPYFAMEYLPGYTVGSLIEDANRRDEHLYLDVVIGILTQICRGLSAVHAAGVVHRDVKPANMLIGPKFRVALTDFGLVEMLRQTTERDLAGTPLYLAPEIIRRQPLPDHQRHLSDIYSLGISTYEMLTGDVPFDGQTVKEILRRHVSQPPKPVSEIRSDLPQAVDQVLLRCLDKDPRSRFEDCGEFIEALVAARGGSDDTSPHRSQKILIVEEDAVALQLYSTALKVGFPQATIQSATDGEAALRLIQCSRPDLVVLNLHLPRLNGIELCAALNGDETTADIPAVVLGREFDAASRDILHRLGIESLLSHPVDATRLVGVARRHLGLLG